MTHLRLKTEAYAYQDLDLGNELHPEKVKGQSPSDPLLFDLVSVQRWKSRVPTGNLEYQQKVIIFVPFHIIKMYLTFH